MRFAILLLVLTASSYVEGGWNKQKMNPFQDFAIFLKEAYLEPM